MPFTFSGAFNRFLTLLSRNFALFAGLGLVGAIIPLLALNYFLFTTTGATTQNWFQHYATFKGFDWVFVVVVTLLCWIIGLIYLAFVTEVAILRSVNKPVSFGPVIGHAVNNALPLFMVSLVVMVVYLCGLVLLVVPGLMFIFAAYVAIPARIGEPNLGIWASVKRSFDLTRGHRWTIFALTFVVGLVLGAVYWAVMSLITHAGLPPIVSQMSINLFQSIVGLLNHVFVAAIYVSLRESHDRLAPDQAASVFE